MDTVLMAVTALSLAMAGGMALIVAKLVREERARAEARVAALGAMSADPVVDSPLPRPAVVPRRQIVVAPAVSQSQRSGHAARFDDLEIRSSDSAVSGVSSLFAETDRPSPWGRRFAVIASLAVVVLVIGFATMSGKGRPSTSDTPATSVAQRGPALDATPLELLSLHHAQEQHAQRFVISGLVQNPRSGAPLFHVVATAFLFGPDGTFLTSSRAPLDFTNLTPGIESPFVVSVPVTGQVARYRIGFRTEDGRVIAHVDKRGPDALAQK
jgi:hypothetical protein